MKPKKSPVHFGSPLCTEVIACLEECFQDLEAGRAERWHADPYFERETEITPADADRVIAALDQEFGSEIDRFPDYHRRKSGSTAKPDWHRLPPSARLGLAQRLARIIDRYE